MGQMILHGTPPYQEAYNLKPPGIYLAYAAVMAVFGESPSGIHTGLLLVNLACAFLLFLITRKIAGLPVAVSTTAAFLALSLMPKVLGLNAHATHFVLLPALGGIFLLSAGGDPVPNPERQPRPAADFLLGDPHGNQRPDETTGDILCAVRGVGDFRGAGDGDRGGRENPGRRVTTGGRGKAVIGDLVFLRPGSSCRSCAALAWLSLPGVFDTVLVLGGHLRGLVRFGGGFGEGMEIAAIVGWSILAPSLVIGILACARPCSMRDEPYAKKYFVVALLLSARFSAWRWDSISGAITSC